MPYGPLPGELLSREPFVCEKSFGRGTGSPQILARESSPWLCSQKMSLQALGSFELAHLAEDQVSLRSNEGFEARVEFSDEAVMRLRILRPRGARLKRSWAVADAQGEFPREGLSRDEIPRLKLNCSQAQSDFPELVSSQMRVQLSLKSLGLKVFYKDQAEAFHEDLDDDAYLFDRGGHRFCHFAKAHSQSLVFGLGEKTGALNRNGRRFRLAQRDSLAYDAETSDPLYKHWPFYFVVSPDRQSYCGFFYDNPAEGVFDFGQELHAYRGLYRYYEADDGDLDLYIFCASSVSELISNFLNLVGRPMLPPDWSLSYIGSGMNYTESENATERIDQFFSECEKREVSCRSFQLSSGYTLRNDKRYVFQWSKERFPEPEQWIHSQQQEARHIIANVKPFLLEDHPDFKTLALQKSFIQSGSSHLEAKVWGGKGALLDFTRPKAWSWWQEQARTQLIEIGVESLWNDNNEFFSFEDGACFGFGEPVDFSLMRPIQSLLMTRASHEVLKASKPETNGFVQTRSGYVGLQRYAQTWTGDNVTHWKTLRANLSMGLGMSLSGILNFGHDVGGFAGPLPEPELLVRWIQLGIYMPRFCIHSWKSDSLCTEFWQSPEVEEVATRYIKKREALIPYLKECFIAAHQSGKPIQRPLFYDFGLVDQETFHLEDQFMFGDQFLVAPVLERGQESRELYLPKSCSWKNETTGKTYSGGQWLEVDSPIETCPVFEKN